MNYLQYLLKAKGRHGTHSPFIYQFVAQALHEPKEQLYPKANWGKGKAKQLNKRLYRVLTYLQEYPSYSCLGFTDQYKDLFALLKMHEVAADQLPKGKFLLVCTADDLEWQLTNLPEPLKNDTIIVTLHPNNSAYALVNAVFKDAQFNCTVFTWDFSLMIFSQDFKRKQHFVLR